MPMKDRTFSPRDIVRIYCNHLEVKEQVEVLQRFCYSPTDVCSETTILDYISCDTLEAIIEALNFLCDLWDMVKRRLDDVNRVPVLRRLVNVVMPLDAAIQAVCDYSDYLEMLLGIMCNRQLALPGGSVPQLPGPDVPQLPPPQDQEQIEFVTRDDWLMID